MGAYVSGGAGEPDPINGQTLHYSTGHSADWLETDSAVLQDELAVMALINNHRAAIGIVTLDFERALARCARGHSRHSFEHGDFMGHVNPEGYGFEDRMAANGIDFRWSGEIITYGPKTPEAAFQAWLNSAPHREIMEQPCYLRIGVGRHLDAWTVNFAR